MPHLFYTGRKNLSVLSPNKRALKPCLTIVSRLYRKIIPPMTILISHLFVRVFILCGTGLKQNNNQAIKSVKWPKLSVNRICVFFNFFLCWGEGMGLYKEKRIFKLQQKYKQDIIYKKVWRQTCWIARNCKLTSKIILTIFSDDRNHHSSLYLVIWFRMAC